MFKLFKIAILSRATISFGVPTGARMPYQLMTSYPGSPDSAIVGRLGVANERLALVTASAFNLPALTWGSAGGMLLNINDTLPPRRSVSAGTARLSITGCWPQLSARFWPMIRARISAGPPGGNGTTMRIGLLG